MADESMQSDPADSGSDVIELSDTIPVRIDSLEADGVRPSVGDTVTLRVEGTVKEIENDCVYVSPEKVNDDDLSELLAENPQNGDNEDAMMAKMTAQADQANMGGVGGGGYG